MSEREKMLRGEPYDASDAVLVSGRIRARRLTRGLAALDPADHDAHIRVLRELLGELGEESWVEAPFYCDYGTQIHIGDRKTVNSGCWRSHCGCKNGMGSKRLTTGGYQVQNQQQAEGKVTPRRLALAGRASGHGFGVGWGTRTFVPAFDRRKEYSFIKGPAHR